MRTTQAPQEVYKKDNSHIFLYTSSNEPDTKFYSFRLFDNKNYPGSPSQVSGILEVNNSAVKNFTLRANHIKTKTPDAITQYYCTTTPHGKRLTISLRQGLYGDKGELLTEYKVKTKYRVTKSGLKFLIEESQYVNHTRKRLMVDVSLADVIRFQLEPLCSNIFAQGIDAITQRLTPTT